MGSRHDGCANKAARLDIARIVKAAHHPAVAVGATAVKQRIRPLR